MNLKNTRTRSFILFCYICLVVGVKEISENRFHETPGHSYRPKKGIDNHTLGHLYEEESLKLIFTKHGKNGTMDYEAFQDFIIHLGLGNKPDESHDDHDHEDHDDHDHQNHNDHNHHNHIDHVENRKVKRVVPHVNDTSNVHGAINQCLPAKELYQSLETSAPVTKEDLLTICPVLLHQLDTQACNQKKVKTEEKIPVKQVWGYSFASVTIISLVSITGILLVPCTKRYPVIYTNLISFLVAVAIGALMGDALLHLLPHSYGVHSHKGHDEGDEEGATKASTIVWRGTVALAGILLFFTCEKCMHVFKERESHKKSNKTKDSSNDEVDKNKKPAEEPLINRQPLITGCRSVTQGMKFKRLSIQNHNDAHLIHIHNDTQIHQLYESSDIPMVKLECGEDTCDIPCEDSTCPEGQCENQDEVCNEVVQIVQLEPSVHIEQTEAKEDDERSLGHGHSHKHSHGHGHSHDHSFTGGIATVAWMVIMGDGLHNFCDGIAIGAAFANSITGGISTSIAIFCHELPHEIGDFAVMLKSGMSVKKALAYMGLSSFLAYIGMILGVGVGNIEEANLWIFAMTGGMFLYIALVDLLPELLESTNIHFHSVALQTLGVVVGVGIMIIIGLYEETIQQALD
ncbi:zinc transporter ZIP10-like [Antedon mediterranea]|uniref:zinc transporter ZIP10-like n=1 Tax=Antedon mediterranea TaxID=105859 RepID=UPI003AF72F00